MELTNFFSQTTVSWALITLAFSLFLYALSIIPRSHRGSAHEPRKAPPEVGGAWPLTGHLHHLGGPQPPHVTLGNMADEYGPIFRLRLGVHKTLIVSTWEMAKECFATNDKAFANRPKLLAFDVLGYNYAMLGFSPYGSYWRYVRKIAILEFLSSHRLEMLKHVKESEVKLGIKDIYHRCLISDKGVPKMSTEMKSCFGDIVFNVIFRVIIGKRLVGVEADVNDNERNKTTQRVLRDFVDLSGSFPVSDALPYLRWLDLDGKEKAMKKTMRELDQLVQEWLDEHKRKKGTAEKREDEHDFMDALLSAVDEDQVLEAGHDVDTVIKATCLALILAGTDTTTGTLTWALALMLNNPQVLSKAQHELDTKIGRERLVTESDLTKLEYLDAILKETLRLYPPSPLNIPHESMEDCTVGGYYIPAGTRLLTNISKLHRDPRVYTDPTFFRPERFLEEHKSLGVTGQNFELIPFGAGRRICPGISFALQSMQLILANLLHAFHVINPHNEPVGMSEHVGLTNIKASPLQVLLKPRLSSQVYG